MLGLCEAQLGLVAHESFVKSLELDSTSRETWLNLGQACGSRRRRRGETGIYEVPRDGPVFCRGHHALGLLMYGTGDFMQAQSYFKSCVALAQKEDADAAVGALHYAGLCWSALGVFEKAEEYFVRALERDAEPHAAGTRGSWQCTTARCWTTRRPTRNGISSAPSRRATASATPSRSSRPRRREGTCRSFVSPTDVKAATRKWVTASLQFEGLVQLRELPRLPP